MEPMSDGRGLVDAAEKGRAQFPCPRNLVGGHARPEFVFVLAGQRIPLRRGKVQPGIGDHVILRHARAVGVHETEVMLGAGEPCAVASRNHFTASVSFSGTPVPLAYMRPRLFWAGAWP